MHIILVALLLLSFNVQAKKDGFEVCVKEAASYYGIPHMLLKSVKRTEGGKPGIMVKGAKGSLDLGIMQINDSQPWYRVLLKSGFTRESLIYDGCASVWAGAFILASELYQAKDFWRGVGNYNNRREPYHSEYIRRVKMHWNWIQEH